MTCSMLAWCHFGAGSSRTLQAALPQADGHNSTGMRLSPCSPPFAGRGRRIGQPPGAT